MRQMSALELNLENIETGCAQMVTAAKRLQKAVIVNKQLPSLTIVNEELKNTRGHQNANRQT